MNVVTRMLHSREMSVDKLARLSRVGRCQLNLMLSGKRAGRHTWKHVDPFLHPQERDVLRRTTHYSDWENSLKQSRAPFPAISPSDLDNLEATESVGAES